MFVLERTRDSSGRCRSNVFKGCRGWRYLLDHFDIHLILLQEVVVDATFSNKQLEVHGLFGMQAKPVLAWIKDRVSQLKIHSKLKSQW
jgi:hypothetical protein